MRRFLNIAIAAALISPVAARGQERMPFDSLKVGGHVIPFDAEMKLTGVSALLGTADTNTRGDASTSLHWLCYRAVAGRDTAVLAIESSEMGGGIYATSFEVFRADLARDLQRKCVTIAVSPHDIVTDRGIRLGMTRAEVERVLGRATRDSANQFTYDWVKDRRGKVGSQENAPYSECSELDIWYRDGIVVHISGDRLDVT
jgi:hypothetical protein